MIGVRSFSTSLKSLSHIGSAAIFLPKEVTLKVSSVLHPTIIKKGKNTITLNQQCFIEGPRGLLKMELPDFVQVKSDNESSKLTVEVENSKDRIQRSMWGTVRSTLNNHVVGVTEGHLTMLKLQGTGYRVSLVEEEDGRTFVSMKIGKCISEGFYKPEGIELQNPQPNRLVISGNDKQKVKLFAGTLRNLHPPEPYKGKGIYIDNETIKLKDKKIK
ncbi:hypothetical protein LJB42_004213 [Komagataella kurtzmanii]|nr:hypothetical protein LJB42_004213 [Komagataella kurtzmanii]